MSIPRALVLRAPGINCDRETAHACRLAGFETHLVHINQLIMQPQRLLDFHFLVIPGGFSYGDDLGAGTLLAKNLTIHLGPQLRRFIDEGWPVLGICNGFQVLVRAGLLPGLEETTDQQPFASLTNNASAQFECRWVTLSVFDSPCLFTRNIDHPIELPVAHGEGRFVLADQGKDNGGQKSADQGGDKPAPLPYTEPFAEQVDRSRVGARACPRPENLAPALPRPGNLASACPRPENLARLQAHRQIPIV